MTLAPLTATGSGSVALTVGANTATTTRSGSIVIAGVTVAVTQAAYVPSATLPSILTNGVVNSASYAPEIGPNSYVTVYAKNLAPAGLVTDWNSVIPASSSTLPVSLAGVRVKIGGKDTYVYYVNADLGMATVLVPPGIPAGTATVELTTGTGTTTGTVVVKDKSPAFFAYTLGGKLYPSALFANEVVYVNQVGALAGVTSRPAKSGDHLVFYANSLGRTAADIPVGQAFAPGQYFVNADPSSVHVLIGGVEAPVEFVGMAIAGLWQVNILVPPGISPGEQTVVLKIGEQTTQPSAVLPFGN